MYIAPNSTIMLLRNVPIDNSYEHTLYFANATAQANYFSSKAKYTLDKQTYVRHTNGYIRVNLLADNLFDCNYLMFKNTSFGNKWFYAFITDIEYVNNDVASIEYQIDVMQTWMFDYTLQQVFVEREHSVTDNVGDNLIPENLETGDYIISNYQLVRSEPELNDYCYMAVTSFEADEHSFFNVAKPEVIGNIMQGLEFTFFDNATQLANFIETRSAKIDGILYIYQVPSLYKTNYVKGAVHRSALASDVIILNNTPNYIGNAKEGTYTPKNKKLLTAPYNVIYVDNGQGNSATFSYEYFATQNDGYIRFLIEYIISANPSYCLTPYGYKTSNYGLYNRNEKMFISNLPEVTWSNDAFLAWLAQNAGSIAVTGLSVTAGMLMGNPVLSGMGVRQVRKSTGLQTTYKRNRTTNRFRIEKKVKTERTGETIWNEDDLKTKSRMNICEELGTLYDHAIMPPQAHGNADTTGNMATEQFTFRFYPMQIRPEFARIIDEYFTMYGYATHRVKTPNTHSRPHWNYVETRNCKITGSIPSDDEEIICNIYDNGITFWKNPNEVGDYTLDNSPS